MNNLSFKEHFNFFINKIQNNENFALTRYGDGERLVIQNESVSYNTQAFNVDKWSFNKNKIFSEDLKNTSFHRESDFYYGIPCTCCDLNGLNFYKKLFENHNITFANLFVNSNYEHFELFIKNLNRQVVLIANKNCLFSEYPFNILQKIPIENDCVNWYELNKDTILKGMDILSKKYNNTLFFISAGPLSEIIIHNLYLNNPNNCYIDVGSSLDVFTHKKITRPYQILNSEYAKKDCVFV